MSDLTTTAKVKAWAGIKTSDDDALIASLVAAYSAYIQTWLNRQILSAQYTETRSGNGGAQMVFADYPVTAVSMVKVDGREIQRASAVGVAGYRFTSTKLILAGYAFTKGDANVELAYAAGFADVPDDLEQACNELVALRYKERDRIGHQSKSLAGETVSFIVKDFPDSVRTILNNYRKVVPL